ncbi:integrin beta-PS isoform X1 [Folsomia candida]|uniref:integrin beta-PS isoform X1 n=1 Tax=Folsomia candida TaxID=158441 RepID=UPI000B9038AD|nr:integrin beta-PS isoform X1 [Folsomia candida]
MFRRLGNRQVIVVSMLLVAGVIGSAFGQTNSSSCTAKKSCGECIRSPDCVWCSQPRYERSARNPYPRCNTATKHLAYPSETRCRDDFLINPSHEFELRKDEEITKGSEHREAIQIRPQNVYLKLRVGQSFDLNMQYAQAEDYPVDLYYLMDLSKSMEDDKEELSNLGNLLSETMQNLTSNFRLGFGSFVDKVVMPFVSTVEKNLLQPCPGCVSPFGYQNVMSLSRDTQRFSGEVKSARVSGNLDAPEGGFDAIMQAIVCDQIGWRQQARRLIVFSTDASFHYAGDGLLGGIVKPNDGKCHLDSRGEYTYSTIQDYPSVAHINSKVKEKSINMIFAVTAEQIDIYERLSQQVEGSSCGVLAADSKNVVELVKSQYQKITSSVELKDTASAFIKVSYFSNCVDPPTWVETNKCSGLRVGDVVNFKVKIEVTECPKDPIDWRQKFTIYRVGLEESLTVDLESICDCPCETPGNPGYEEFSPECGGFGTLTCGVCECDEKHFGRKCECDVEGGGGTRVEDDSGCRADNTTDIICTGRGTCNCGQCECFQRENPLEKIDGQYCECDNFNCPRESELICSGPGHGRCDCGKCICNPGWSGDACQCSLLQDTCVEPGDTIPCNGHGNCVCGKCSCNTTVARYYGRWCEKCPTCPGRCEELKDCVQCRVHGTGEFNQPEICENECVNFPEPEKVDVASSDEESEEKYCAFTDHSDGCRFYFVYGYDVLGKLYIRAQRTKDCPPEPPIFWIISGVVGAIVLVGLLFILLWKLLTHIHDRAEYARFEKERMSAKWDAGENPIYKQATSTFKNPMYSGR